MADPLCGGVVGPRHGAADVGQVLPELRRRLWQPDMDVAMVAERAQQLDLGDGESGVAEQRQPGRQFEVLPTITQPGKGFGVPDIGRRFCDAVEQSSPQLGLPEQVLVEDTPRAVGVATFAPVGHERRTLDGVGRVEAGQATGDGVAAVAAQLAVVTGAAVTEVGGEGGRPRLAEVGVDGLEEDRHGRGREASRPGSEG